MGRYLVSHSYRDKDACDRLLRALPPEVEPVVFPPITVPPDQLVSNELVQTILHCDGVIYLRTPNSDESFWVAFERDYALHAGKQVYAFNPEPNHLTRVRGPGPRLPVFASYAGEDTERVRRITDFLRDDRYVDLGSGDTELAPGSDLQEAISRGISDRVRAGGYVAVFWSRHAAESDWINRAPEHPRRARDR